LLAPLACVAALAGLGVAASDVQPQAGNVVALRAGSAPVDAVTLVCPSVTGTPAGLATTMSVADLGGALRGGRSRVAVTALPLPNLKQNGTGKRPPGLSRFVLSPRPVVTVRKTTPYAAIAVTARGPGAAHVVADQVGFQAQGLSRAATDSGCLSPAGDWWFAGADGEVGFDDTLLLANPADGLANVAVSAWGALGPLRVSGLDSLTVPPRGFVGLKVSAFAPNAQHVAIHVRVQSGSVVAALVDRRIRGNHPAGTEWIPPTSAPATGFVVAGLPSGPGSRHLLLANPGTRDATVGLRVMTRTGNFEPAGRQSIVVPAGRGADVDLSAAVAEEPAAVVGTSDQPIVAEARMTAHERGRFEETAWLPATAPLSGPAGLAASTPPFGQTAYLVLAAPRSAVRVRIAEPTGPSAVVTVPAGRTLRVDLPVALHVAAVGALALVPLDDGPVYAARVLYAEGSHGPLLTTETPQLLPAPITLPPVVEDPRAASR
jgi:hypothetical protein